MSDLPAGFEYLAPYAETWGRLPDQQQRYLYRQKSAFPALQNFYETAAPRLDDIFGHLDRFPIDQPLPEPEARLFAIALGLAEAAQAVECYGEPGIPFAAPEQIVSIVSTQY